MSEHEFGVDIPERPQAEQAQRRMDELFRALIENALDVITILDAEGVIRYQSPSVERVLGYKPAELISLNVVELLHPDDVPKVNVALKAAAPPDGTPGIAQVVEARLRHKDGSWRILESIGKALPSGLPVTGIVVNSRDITERKRAEEALRKSEILFSKTFNDCPAPMTIASQSDGRCIAANESYLRLIECDREEVIGHTSTELNLIDSEARAEIMRQLHQQRAMHNVEVRARTKSGRPIIVQTSYQNSELAGEACIISTMIDITERRRAEEALRETRDYLNSLIHYANAPIIVWDPQGRITRFNHAFEHLTGYTADEVIGQELHMLFPEASRDESLQEIAHTLSGEYWESVEIPILRKDGDIRVALWNSANIHAEDGTTLLATIAQGHDITERKWAEEALRESEEKYRNVVERANDGICIIQDTIVKYLNLRLAEMWGGTTEEVIGTPFTNYVHPDELLTVVDRYKRRMAGEDVIPIYETALRHKDGSKVYAELNAGVITYQGRPADLMFVRDITERKRAEEALRTTAARLARRLEMEQALSSISARFVQPPDLDEAINLSLGKLGRLVGVHRCYLFRFSDDGRTMDNTHEWCSEGTTPQIQNLQGLDVDIFPWWVERLRQDENIVIPDVAQLPPEAGSEKEILEMQGIRSLLVVPLHLGGRLYGFLGFDNVKGTRIWLDEDVRLLRTASEIMARGIERKRAEEALRESEERYRSLFDGVPVGLYRTTVAGQFLDANPALAEMLGHPDRESLLATNVVATYVDPEERQRWQALMEREGVMRASEVQWRCHDGTVIWVQESAHAVRGTDGRVLYYEGGVENITERKRAEEELRASEQRYRLLFERNLAGVYRSTLDGRILDCNESYARMFGYDSQEEVLALRASELYFDAADRETFITRLREQGTLTNSEWCLRRKDGSPVWVLENASLIEGKEGAPPFIQGTLVNITKRKRAERLMQALNAAALAMERALTPEEIFTTVARELKKLGFSCIVFLTDESQSRLLIRYVSYEARAIKVLEKLTGFKIENFSIPIETADVYRIVIQERKAAFIENVEDVTRQFLPKPLKKFTGHIMRMLKIARSIPAPLIVEDKAIGLLSVESDDLTVEDIPAITAFAHQMAAAWRKAQLMQDLESSLAKVERAQEELQHSYAQLRRTFEGTVNVLVSAIEMRDPYTAGHQRRVTQLVCAIAKEMGLPEEQIEGLRMAGLIHDIGKISIPAEVLSKPGPLSDLQYGLIQAHAQVGYDVLNGAIDFPWPVAQIVLQHHERMNGSGYPQGLSGEEIILEARILAVSDVVEAMASHRPYRPARGIEKALEEISQNRGVLYDPEVVDVCLKLFIEEGFAFEYGMETERPMTGQNPKSEGKLSDD